MEEKSDWNQLRCSLRISRTFFLYLSVLPLLLVMSSSMCFPSLFFVTAHVCVFAVSFTSPPFFLFVLITTFLFSASPPSHFPLYLYLCCGCCNPGGVSSGQSYPSTQYESGLQQRGQQGKQPRHQPCTLLHTPWWVAVVEGSMSKFKMRRRRKVFILLQWLI